MCRRGEKPHNLCSSPGVIRVIHEGNMRWAENVVRMRNVCTVYSMSVKRRKRSLVDTAGGGKRIILLSLYVMPCSFVDIYQRFAGTFCLHLQGRGVNTSGSYIQITPRLNRENYNFRFHRREKLRSYVVLISVMRS
jgi:hypothetical protein